ncbi:MAG: FKBP-type peptidyl-prolyl cis-trans isomerase [Oleiphilaceae bacterium]|nr:FKBP-type peptidyl-prolyl cis-trans isomerase [Oleiphilaceae bacterium]
MRKTLLAMVMAATAGTGFAADPVKNLETQEQKVSYSFGVVFGKRMTVDLPELDMEAFVQGLGDAFNGKATLLTDEEVGQVLSQYQRDMQQEQMDKMREIAVKNKELGEAFLAENKNKEGVVTLASGLQYKVLEEGKGPQPGPNDKVTVHYTGSLINGEVFDSSVERGQPASFPLNGVIAGWTEALQLMPQGSKWRLFIPAELAYGSNGNRTIGPNETLLFDVELLDIERKK